MNIDAPHIAALQRELMRRHWSFATDPYEVPIETYLAASAEMEALMRDRGWPVRSADIGRSNFLLMGVPICPSETIQ